MYVRQPCICGLADCVCDPYVTQLDAEDLGELERHDLADDTAILSSRGSGKVKSVEQAQRRDETRQDLERRKALLALHHFASDRRGKRQRRIYAAFADGLSTRHIAKRFRVDHRAIQRTIKVVERQYARGHAEQSPDAQLARLVGQCDPSTVVLFYSLLERAVEDPEGTRALMARMRAVPEIRQILEPDDLRAEAE